MATKEELDAHLNDCIGWRQQVQSQLTDGFDGIDKRLDAQDALLEFVKTSQTIYNSGKRVVAVTFSALGFLATVIEAMRGLGILHH